jgi:hypothetical protein
MRFATIAACAVWVTLAGIMPGHTEKRVGLVVALPTR